MITLPDGTYETAVRADDRICIGMRPHGEPTGPDICDIPANGPWSSPVIAGTVEVDGTRYLIGVSTDQVRTVKLTSDPTVQIALLTHQSFSTLRFFALPAPAGPVTLSIDTRSEGTVTLSV
jgi:hypothetical protein